MDAWMLRRLRFATRAQQCLADADALAWISQPVTRDRYREFLIRIYGIEAPLESAFALVGGLSDWLAGARHKIALLADDLCALHVWPDRLLALPRCRIAPFRDWCEALGWVYVLDANLTNRQILARRLARTSHAFAATYLAAHEDRGELAIEHVESPRDATEIVQAAIDAYDCQHRWLRPDALSVTAIERRTSY